MGIVSSWNLNYLTGYMSNWRGSLKGFTFFFEFDTQVYVTYRIFRNSYLIFYQFLWAPKVVDELFF